VRSADVDHEDPLLRSGAGTHDGMVPQVTPPSFEISC
jgi:hypothetical protein